MTAKKYSLGLVGRKAGMTRVFTEDGKSIPVTLIEATPNRITQLKTPASDGYAGVQVTFGKRRASRVLKPAAGHFAKAGLDGFFVLGHRNLAGHLGGLQIGLVAAKVKDGL